MKGKVIALLAVLVGVSNQVRLGLRGRGPGTPMLAVEVAMWLLILWFEMKMPTTIEALLDRAFKRHRVIPNCDGDPYLLRWYVFKSPWVTLFVHKFIRSDEDRALHDHPWAFLVVPIWRGYVEHSVRNIWSYRATPETGGRWEKIPGSLGPSPFRRRVLPILGTRLRPATYRHRVELIRKLQRSKRFGSTTDEMPAWSLFFHFPRVRDWGFWTAAGWIKWNVWGRDHKCVE